MVYYVSDLAEAIDEHDRAVDDYHEGNVSEDDVADAKQDIVEIVHFIYFDDGEFNKTAYEMHKPNGALITVQGKTVYVEVASVDCKGETENFRIPSPGPY